MAILIRQGNQKSYASSTGFVTDEEKTKADKLDIELNKSIKELESKLLKNGLVTKGGKKTDALRVWYEFGRLLNRVGKSYRVLGTTDEPFFWRSIYGYVSPLIQKGEPPRENQFERCSFIARYNWNTVKRVGTWSVWKDLLDNSKILEDRRVFDWIVRTISSEAPEVGHKRLRPFIHEARRRITNKDTKVLSDEEINKKLSDLKALLRQI